MKNKKGFTLIELLAVIVVLAIIMLLAVQAILPQMEKARKNGFAVEANGAIDAAQTYIMSQILEGTTNPTCVKIATLVSNGNYEAPSTYSGYVQVGASGQRKTYTVYLTNGSTYYVQGHGTGSDKSGKVDANDVKQGKQTITAPTGCV